MRMALQGTLPASFAFGCVPHGLSEPERRLTDSGDRKKTVLPGPRLLNPENASVRAPEHLPEQVFLS